MKNTTFAEYYDKILKEQIDKDIDELKNYNQYEDEYYNLVHYVYNHGTDIFNKRTGYNCRTIPTHVMVYDRCPMISHKQVFFKMFIAEFIGYLRGYTSAKQFRDLGTRTWDANANETKAWLINPNRKGEDDMGNVYGAIARDFGATGGQYDLLWDVYEDLQKGIDNRGEIITFWDPSRFDEGCLRPCMMMHQFQLIGDTLHLTSYQRSTDILLGGPANMLQAWFFLELMARITGHKVGKVTHVMNNIHIYENQFESCEEFLKRVPNTMNNPRLVFDDQCVDLVYVLDDSNGVYDIVTLDGYHHNGKIDIPFAS
ncbi:thymidylate synthase [Aeromonas phage avDM6]|nr:thymidylate synthase [Aeromonas phage avDM6]